MVGGTEIGSAVNVADITFRNVTRVLNAIPLAMAEAEMTVGIAGIAEEEENTPSNQATGIALHVPV